MNHIRWQAVLQMPFNHFGIQAEVEAPVKPSQAVRDLQGRVNLDSLTEGDLDYGTDLRGLANLRRRLTRVLFKFNGLGLTMRDHLHVLLWSADYLNTTPQIAECPCQSSLWGLVGFWNCLAAPPHCVGKIAHGKFEHMMLCQAVAASGNKGSQIDLSMHSCILKVWCQSTRLLLLKATIWRPFAKAGGPRTMLH